MSTPLISADNTCAQEFMASYSVKKTVLNILRHTEELKKLPSEIFSINNRLRHLVILANISFAVMSYSTGSSQQKIPTFNTLCKNVISFPRKYIHATQATQKHTFCITK